MRLVGPERMAATDRDKLGKRPVTGLGNQHRPFFSSQRLAARRFFFAADKACRPGGDDVGDIQGIGAAAQQVVGLI